MVRMNSQESPSVHDLLDKLEREVANAKGADPEHSRKTLALATRIRDRLDQHFDEDLQAELLAEVESVITHFEVNHPTLTAAIQRVASALSAAGI